MADSDAESPRLRKNLTEVLRAARDWVVRWMSERPHPKTSGFRFTLTGMRHTGRHFLQIPGPTNVPDRVLRAMDHPVIDHRGPEFADLTRRSAGRPRLSFSDQESRRHLPVVGHGRGRGRHREYAVAWRSGPDLRDRSFLAVWRGIGERFDLAVDYVPGTWRHGASDVDLERRLRLDEKRTIKAVIVVHNETSTGVTSRIGLLRRAMDRAGHQALLIIDAVSSLASIDYRHDEWRVDVTVTGSQKGLMLPPGLGFNAVSEKALAARAPRRPSQELLGLAGDSETESIRLLSVYSGHQPLVRRCGKPYGCCARKACERLSAARPSRGRCQGGGPGLGAGSRLRGRSRDIPVR